MRDTIELGSAPWDEDYADISQENYPERGRAQCRAFLNQLIRAHGKPPDGAKLSVKGLRHDFGTYYEVVVSFDSDDDAACDYAFKLEAESPQNWDDDAKRELGMISCCDESGHIRAAEA